MVISDAAGLLAGSVRLPEYLFFYMGMVPPFSSGIRANGLQEFFLTMFLSFYLVCVYRRARAISANM